jgi:hypothetical protein
MGGCQELGMKRELAMQKGIFLGDGTILILIVMIVHVCQNS